MTKVKTFVGLLAAAVIFAVVINAGAFRDNKTRNCGAGIRPIPIVAVATWAPKADQERSYVRINGFIGPAMINEPRTRTSPARYPAQACPGETAAITVAALAGPLPSIVCAIRQAGSSLTGSRIQREGVAGYRASCQAVIR